MEVKRNLFMKMISAFLAAIMIVQILPMSAWGAETANETESDSSIASDDYLDTAEILSEYTENRGEYTKEFRMSDGTIQAVQYSAPVHFKQNGKWVDYDNSLKEVDADEEENEGKTLKNKDLVNSTADYSIRLWKKTNGKKFVRIEKNKYKLSWYYSNAKKSTAKIVESKDDGDPTTLEKLSSDVIYKDVYKNTDFEYIVGSNGLKENIILGGANAPTELRLFTK